MNSVIREAYNKCRPEQFIQYGDSRYVDFSAQHLRGSGEDIFRTVETTIGLSDAPGLHLLSGHIGSGKTTELKQMEHRLQQAGYQVVYIDTECFLNLSMPATVLELWVAIAAGLEASLSADDRFGAALARIGSRINAALTSVIDMKTKLSALGAEVEFTPRANPDLFEQIDTHLGQMRPKLIQECQTYVEEAIAKLRHADPRPVVLMIDSFEKVRGNASNEVEVRRSVESLFTRDWPLLQSPPCHTVMLVPPWLSFTLAGGAGNIGPIPVLPVVKVQNADRTAYEPGIEAVVGLVRKRLDIEALFGDVEPVRRLVAESGGFIRDLLRLLQSVLRAAASEGISLPMEPAWLADRSERAILELRDTYDMALDADDGPLYAAIDENHDVAALNREDRFRVAGLFDHHVVLCYQNGSQWFALHPLVRATKTVQLALTRSEPPS